MLYTPEYQENYKITPQTSVGYCSIITKLHSDAPVMIEAGVDYLVYEWIE